MTHPLPGAFTPSYIAVALTLALPAFSTLALANTPDHIEHITVEGSNGQTLAGHTSVLTASEIERKGSASGDTAALMRGLPGVHLNATGGLSSLPAIHGLSDDRLRVKVNGMDLIASCPNHMNPPLSYLAPSDVDLLTVYTGISPVSVGGDSLGGTIIAESLPAEFLPRGETQFDGELGGFYRSNNQAKGANLLLRYTTDTVLLSYQGNWTEADNYTAAADFKTAAATGHLAPDEVGSSAYETQNHQLRLGWQVNSTNSIDARLNYQNMPLQLYPNQRMDLLNNEQINLNLAWYRDTDWGQLTTRFYHERVEHMMNFGADKQFWYGTNARMGSPCEPIRFKGDPEGTCAAGMPMYSQSDNNGLTVKADYVLAANDVLRLGVELQQYRLDDYWTPSGGGMGPGTFLNINNGERDRIAVYLEREHAASHHWMLLYGMRYENVAMQTDDVTGYAMSVMAPGMQLAEATAFNQGDRGSTDHNLDFTLVARYHASDSLSAELGYAHKVRSANLYEKYTWSSWAMAAGMNNLTGDGNGYVGNASLKPEQAQTVSASLNWHDKDQNHVSISAYYTDITDYIDVIAANSMWMPGQFNVLRYDNQSARIFGADIEGNWHISHGPGGHWQLNGTVSLTDGENKDTGSGLYQIIPLQGSLSLSHQLNGWHSSLEWIVVDNKDDTSAIRNEIATAGYGLLNLQVSHEWDTVRIDAGIENLTNKFYFNPTAGAYTGQGMTMSLNGIPYGIAVPGMGRAVFAGIKVKF
ncbi:TonB-dependent receptor plug domain-containing protein [Alteromonas lipolytica]|uniref:TonB-dependent receptor n=1 Tax=Alteromonas lipolytica TaxID=1856405 RepID=A0A1E8FHA4_9ALTE|nr:TonB-dependent receptor [Alteromonas lipolytica]OFI34843.1 TonB-dependent receptor [Alteromonas lipolytica]GGF54438.1 TonB-dependent receptor [Alteromonas lipolytica]